MSVYCAICRVTIILFALSSLAGCGKLWSWFDDDEDVVYEEIDFEEEMVEEEIIEEEFEEEAAEDDYDYEYEEEYSEEYGDEPRYADRERASASAPAPKRTMIYFDYKQSSVPASGLNMLQLHAQYLAANPQMTVTVEGHTDSVAPPAYNKRLGMQRAQAVAEMLVNMGVSPQQINIVSYGEERPLKSGTGAQANALNRRVEIVY